MRNVQQYKCIAQCSDQYNCEIKVTTHLHCMGSYAYGYGCGTGVHHAGGCTSTRTLHASRFPAGCWPFSMEANAPQHRCAEAIDRPRLSVAKTHCHIQHRYTASTSRWKVHSQNSHKRLCGIIITPVNKIDHGNINAHRNTLAHEERVCGHLCSLPESLFFSSCEEGGERAHVGVRVVLRPMMHTS